MKGKEYDEEQFLNVAYSNQIDVFYILFAVTCTVCLVEVKLTLKWL